MKLAIYSHCAIDTITIDNSSYEQIGGAACYGGYAAKSLKSDVELFTKFGSDFPYKEYLDEKKIIYKNALSEKPTTKFTINILGSDRTLSLLETCEPIEYEQTNADGVLVSPIFNEITNETFNKIKNDAEFLFLDPQGFLRKKNSDGKIILDKTDISLSGVTAIKISPDELQALTNNSGVDGMKLLQKQGIEYILYTDKSEISLLVKDTLYSITLPNLEIYDTTGVGDIFSATFACTMLKENDFLWGLCFAGGSAQAALDSKKVGLDKVPKKGATETNASYFYNLVKFEQV